MIERFAGIRPLNNRTLDLYLVRHAETAANSEKRVRGWLDWGLDAEGLAEMAKTARALKAVSFRALLSSDLKRARQSAAELGKLLNLRVALTSGARTWNLGALTGQKESVAKPLVKWFLAHPDLAPPGGESFREAFVRWATTLERVVRGLERASSPQAFGIVTHHTNLLMAPSVLNGGPLVVAPNPKLSPAGFLHTRREAGRWTIQAYEVDGARDEDV